MLTVENEEQAWRRARVDGGGGEGGGDKGGFAARACLAVISLRRKLLGQVR
ncbi:MAG: hypothetical protein ACHP84_05615 [Caulobacterales bacterium]